MARDNVMHLVWCVDDRVQVPLSVAIGSALRCCKMHPVSVHLVTTGLPVEFVAHLRTLCLHLGAAELDVVEVGSDKLSNLQSTEWITKAAYLRFMLGSIFSQLDRILYLDYDVLILRDLGPLWETPLEGFACAGSDKEWAHDPSYCEQIGLSPSDVYINTGVLLMNLRFFREHRLEERLMNYARTATITFPCVDQDVLNIVLRGQIKTIPFCWNFTLHEYKDYPREAPQAVVLHYTSPVKPWSARKKCLDWRGWLWLKVRLELEDLLPMTKRRRRLGCRLERLSVCCVERFTRLFL